MVFFGLDYSGLGTFLAPEAQLDYIVVCICCQLEEIYPQIRLGTFIWSEILKESTFWVAQKCWFYPFLGFFDQKPMKMKSDRSENHTECSLAVQNIGYWTASPNSNRKYLFWTFENSNQGKAPIILAKEARRHFSYRPKRLVFVKIAKNDFKISHNLGKLEISFSRFSRKLSVLGYMLLHKSYINVAIAHILVY